MGGCNWATEVTQGIQGDLMNADLMSRLVEVPPAVTFLPHTHDGSGELWGERTETLNLLQKYTQPTLLSPLSPTPLQHLNSSVYLTDMCILTLIKLCGEDDIWDKTVHLLHDGSTSGEATVVVPDLKEVIPLSHAH